MWKKVLGGRGEDAASDFLKKQGYRVEARNVSLKRGEIDIIAWDKEVLVLVEVKTRSSERFGLPEEAVDVRKAKKIALAAEEYIREAKLHECSVRCDVVAIIINELELEIKLIKNAVELGDHLSWG